MTTSTMKAQDNDLATLNDEFDHASSIKEWTAHHETEGWPDFTHKQEIRETESVFYIEPKTTGWYGNFHRGPFHYKEVTGNFTLITRIKVTGLNTPSPRRGFSLAGLMVRAPRPQNVSKHAKGHENWMFLSTGSAKKKGKPEFESKNTVNGKSKLKVLPARNGWVELALSRVDSTFYQLYRYEGTQEWKLLRTITRPDMPETLQAGMLAYTDFWPLLKWFIFGSAKKFNTQPLEGKPDLIARYDYVRFYRLPEKLKLNAGEGIHNRKLTEQETGFLLP